MCGYIAIHDVYCIVCVVYIVCVCVCVVGGGSLFS